jgi:hypothetical protein
MGYFVTEKAYNEDSSRKSRAKHSGRRKSAQKFLQPED